MPLYEVSLGSSNNTDVTTWHKLRQTPNGSDYATSNSAMSQQIAGFSASGSATGAAGTLGIAWVDPNATSNKIIKYVEATLTPNARRSNLTNAGSNDFMIDIAFPDGTAKVDLLEGGELRTTVVGTTDTPREGPIQVFVGLVAVGGLGTVTLRYALTRAL